MNNQNVVIFHICIDFKATPVVLYPLLLVFWWRCRNHMVDNQNWLVDLVFQVSTACRPPDFSQQWSLTTNMLVLVKTRKAVYDSHMKCTTMNSGDYLDLIGF